VLSEQLAERVSPDISGLYSKEEHQGRPQSLVDPNAQDEGRQETKIHEHETTGAAIGEDAVHSETNVLLEEDADVAATLAAAAAKAIAATVWA